MNLHIALRQASQDGTIVGAFATSKREYRNGSRHYFIETSLEDTRLSRQLWLPAWQWQGFSTLPQREIVATSEQPSKRFIAWQEAQMLIHDLEGYSPYTPENQALFEEAKLALQFMGANNDQFDFTVE